MSSLANPKRSSHLLSVYPLHLPKAGAPSQMRSDFGGRAKIILRDDCLFSKPKAAHICHSKLRHLPPNTGDGGRGRGERGGPYLMRGGRVRWGEVG